MKYYSVSPQSHKGFALISTILIASLLLLLAVGVLNLSTVETRSRRTTNAQAEAQANARVGLMLAIGKLQEAIGPDARATANASILDTDPLTSDIEGVHNPHWLGVYKTINPSRPDDSLLLPIDLRSFSLSDIDWLVSNNNSNTSINPLTPLSGETVTLAQFIKDPNISFTSQDIDGLDSSLLTKAEAGLVEIVNNSGNEGHYAYWVADESMKARIDSLASVDGSDILDGSVVDQEAQDQYNYETIQGNNFESILPNYKLNPNQLSKLISPNTLQVFDEQNALEDWSLLNQDKFTISATSIPIDVTNGSLKKDLTAYIKGSYEGLDQQPIIDPRFQIDAEKTPNFELIKQWANLANDQSTPQAVTASNSISSTQEIGIHPVITQGAVALQHAFQRNGTDSVKAVFMIMPQIQLWNPHNVPLEAQDYIVQVGYSFDWWMQSSGSRGTDQFNWEPGQPQFRSWENFNGQQPLPEHKPVDNELINYQPSKRFFTFVIKNQAFEPGESLVFYASPPNSGTAISGTPYNLNNNADTDILANYSNDEDLNLLVNEGSLDEFFYIIPDAIGTTDNQTIINKIAAGELRMERNFRSRAVLSGNNVDEEDNDIHINLYATNSSNSASLVHAIKKPQKNERFGNWQSPTFSLDQYQDGSLLAEETLRNNPAFKNAVINIGSSMLSSEFDVFEGDSNQNRPPRAGQPHSFLNQWNIRSQESFSSSDNWDPNEEASSWLNTFSFRGIERFVNTWEFTSNLYGNNSTDRLGGWWLSQVPNTAYPFFDYPNGEFGPLSLGSIQHANLSLYGWQPTYAFGNSQAPTRIDRSLYKSDTNDDMFDLSYVLNASIWDSYYLSSIPQSGDDLPDGTRLPNSRMSINLRNNETASLTNEAGFNLAAASTLINGGFNVNSTSVTAWKALLSGAIGQTIEVSQGLDSNDPSAAAMGRFLSPLVEEPESVAQDRTTTQFDIPQSWASTRTLNEEELDALAERLVQEVKLRGPFLSLADFVNRRLVASSTSSNDEKVYQEILGAIQAAINKSSVEDGLINGHYYTNTTGGKLTIQPSTDWVTDLSFNVSNSATEAMFGHPMSQIDSQGGLLQNYAPGFLSQADVLTKIGSNITVRGDTFTIRAYGDSVDSNGNIQAKAWCEAVVQRIVEPVDWDGTDDKLIQPQQPNQEGFGRKIQIISFKWLNEKEVLPYTNDSAID